VLQAAASRPVPQPTDLPAHFTEDYSSMARGLVDRFGQRVDIL
jgi:hypothetical protein